LRNCRIKGKFRISSESRGVDRDGESNEYGKKGRGCDRKRV